MTERVLSLDISSKTGWAFGISSKEGLVLEDYGQYPAIHEPTSEPYPGSYVLWANLNFKRIAELVDRFAPDCLVIEETVGGSKSVYSQKILEYTHYLLAKLIRDTGIKSVYLLTGEWRVLIGAKMTKEEKDRNKMVKEHNDKIKAIGGPKKRARNASGEPVGKIGKKHVNIRRVNEIFAKFLKNPLTKKDEDAADGLGLLAAYQVKRFKNV